MSISPFQRRLLAGGALLLVTLLVYLPSLKGPFLWDDGALVINNPIMPKADGLYRFWCTTEAPDYFPLTSTTWWLEWRLWGDNPTGYRLVNVLLHALSAILLWLVLARLEVPGAWWGAAVFALHPVNVETVAWIAERRNSLAMALMLTSLWCYLRGESTPRRQRWDVAALVAFCAALLSKAAVAPLPCVLLGMAWWKRGCVRWEDLRRGLPFWGVALAFSAVTIWFQYNRVIIDAPVRNDSLLSRAAIAGRAVWFYAGNTLWPVGLSAVYPRWPLGQTDLRAWIPSIFLLMVVVFLWVMRRTTWGRNGLAAVGYFLLMLMPVLGFLNIYFMRYSLVADHWLYFAEIGLVVLVVGTVARGVRRRSVAVAAGATTLLLLGALTWQRAGLYGDAGQLWQDALRKNPESWVVHNNLANALLSSGETNSVLEHYQEALRRNPENDKTYYNLGLFHAGRGDLTNAIAAYRQAALLNHRDADIPYNLGLALGRSGQLAEAADQFAIAARLRPEFVEAYYNRGFALAQLGQDTVAVDSFRAAVALAPEKINARYQLAMALARIGDRQSAIQELNAALRIQPESERLRHALAQFQAQQ